MKRININDNLNSVLYKMSEGNPGAMNCLISILDKKGLIYIINLDILEIYGYKIYVLWNDICNRNTEEMILILDAALANILDIDILKEACSRQDYSGKKLIDIKKIKKEYDEFNKKIKKL